MAGTMMFDWDSATVKVKVPIHHTATVSHEEYEIPMCEFADFIASHLKIEDGVISGCRDFSPPLAITPPDPSLPVREPGAPTP